MRVDPDLIRRIDDWRERHRLALRVPSVTRTAAIVHMVEWFLEREKLIQMFQEQEKTD